MQTYDVLIAGGGAAGLAAGLTLARSRRRVLVVDAGDPRNAPAGGVHNYLGREGTPPTELYAIGRDEVESYGGEVAEGTVESVTGGVGQGFTAVVSGGREVRARRLVVATGIRDELPELPGLAERWGRDALHCPYCHGWEVRDQRIGVIAAGRNAAFALHQAPLFTQWSKDVTLFLNDALEPSADDRARFDRRGVTVVAGALARLVVEDDRITGVELTSGQVVPRDAVVVAPVAHPRIAAFAGIGLEAAEHPFGAAVPVDDVGRTGVPGVWAIGNVSDPSAQVIVSAGKGLMAGAMLNAELLEED